MGVEKGREKEKEVWEWIQRDRNVDRKVDKQKEREGEEREPYFCSWAARRCPSGGAA